MVSPSDGRFLRVALPSRGLSPTRDCRAGQFDAITLLSCSRPALAVFHLTPGDIKHGLLKTKQEQYQVALSPVVVNNTSDQDQGPIGYPHRLRYGMYHG